MQTEARHRDRRAGCANRKPCRIGRDVQIKIEEAMDE
jgi:hypothetical protein